ncbi:MAG TPA: CDP-alcohol phosphatidyltransferase family protein, partial [Solirubrobacteraceae bacterium]|nr:CDP-alcohol phosphatidyltransferase family protein [Solirubrobacteraceae bacterium]
TADGGGAAADGGGAPADGGGAPAAARSSGGSAAGAAGAIVGGASANGAAAPAPRVAVEASADPSSDLRAVARLARDSAGGLVVAHADVVTQREVLAGLAADPRVSTGALATVGPLGRPTAPRIRSARGRIVSAASPYHLVHRPTATFLGVLKVAGDDRAALAAVAERLADLTAPPLPDGWDDELDRKAGMWRGAFARIAARQASGEADVRRQGLLEVDADLDDDAPAGEDEAPERPDDVVLSEADEAELRRRLAAAPDDVVSLLLVGLVRSGAQVGINHLRKLFWARPLSRADVDRAATEIRGYDEDRVLLDSSVKAADGFFTTFFVSTYSKYVARWAARRGLTPNQVTTVSVLIGFLAAAGFATGERWGLVAGAILLQIAFTTDCVDGQLARYTRQFSKLGAWLDSVFDRTKEYAVFAGLAIGYSAAHAGDVWALAGAALTLQTVRHMADFSFGAARQQVIGEAQHPPLEQPSDRVGAGVAATAPARAVAPAASGAGTHGATVATGGAGTQGGATAQGAGGAGGLPRRVLGAWRKLDRWPGMVWVKRMAAFPIGERFAVISITAALWDAKVTFVALLAWGLFAFAYTFAGRFLRSLAR